MPFVHSLLFLLGATLSVAVRSPHEMAANHAKKAKPFVYTKDAPRLTYLEFVVNRSALPEVDFNIGEYTPGVTYQTLELLLGRIGNLSVEGDYTTRSPGNYTGTPAVLRRSLEDARGLA
ncbi:hypothetical protein HYALB_00012738 [Hymenoscyphus albidus]|uniref:Uncharacterized protein n=1 Tax=Hymenoscyphus albidus TaxID=595503 RepID=A0A9N9Q955_9HELO|nr:hypothetical protein HYALB_00012738 [Hymenoscyphus albidus]